MSVPGLLRRGVRNGIAARQSAQRGRRAGKLGHTFLGRENTVESLYLDNFYCAFSRRAAERAFRVGPPRPSTSNYLRYWNRARRHLPALAHAVCRSENVPGGTADEAGPDEYGVLDREPGAVSGSYVRRVRHAHAGPTEDQRQRRRNISSRRRSRICCRAKSSIARRWASPRRSANGCWSRGRALATMRSAIADGFLAAYPRSCAKWTRLIERHRSGFEDATDRIWRLLNLQLWGDVFFTGKRDRWLGSAVPPRKAAE